MLQTPAKIKAPISWLLAGGTRRRPPSNRRRRMEAVAGLFEAQRKAIEIAELETRIKTLEKERIK